MMEEPVAPSQPVTATVETRETQTEEPEPIVRVLDYEEEAVRPIPKPSAAPNKTEGKGKATIMVSFLIAALICATMLYFYKDAIDNNQQDSELLSQQIGEETDENGDATQVSRKWQEVDTYGGKLTENIVQGIARDCLAVKMTELDELGYRTVFHVHDEMVLDVIRKDEGAFKLIDRIMAEPISWAKGLPLKGGTYECDFYRKD